MEYVFGTSGENETLRTKGDHHTSLEGFRQIERVYPDQTITDTFRIVSHDYTDDDDAGNCYDWYTIDKHYRTVDRSAPLNAQIDNAMLGLCDAYEATVEQSASLDATMLALCDIYEQSLGGDV